MPECRMKGEQLGGRAGGRGWGYGTRVERGEEINAARSVGH